MSDVNKLDVNERNEPEVGTPEWELAVFFGPQPGNGPLSKLARETSAPVENE